MNLLNKIINFMKSIFCSYSSNNSNAPDTLTSLPDEDIIDISEEKDMSLDEAIQPVEDVVCSNMPICHDISNYSLLAVCIDNGHGEETPGKRSPYALNNKNLPALYFREYLFAREIAKLVKEKLEHLGVSVFMCTPETTDVALSTRAKRANDYKASHPGQHCVFVSIHSNAYGDGSRWCSPNGWTCWTTKGKTNSDELAACLYDAALEIFPKYSRKVNKRGASRQEWNWEANFTVIYKATMPAVLTENFFQDNIEDVEFMLSDEGKQAIADVHVNGILKYAKKMWGI